MVSSRFRLVLKSVEQYELVEFWRISCARPSLFVFSKFELNCMICSLLSTGIAAEHRYVGVENRDSMIVRENASLYWTTSIVYESVERYRISCKKTTVDAARSPRMKDVWFSKTEKQATATPSSKIHPRVEILTPATLSIQRVDLSDEGLYTCEITTAFPAIRKAMNLNVIG